MSNDHMTDELLRYIENKLILQARKAEESAGYNGDMPPLCATQTADRLALYRDGYNKRIPSAWACIADQYCKEGDPEYQEYLRLKNKFEGEN